MKIRQEQMETMSKSLEDAFVARMVRHLRDNFPDECEKQGLEEKDFEPLVRRGMADAERYGVVYETDIQVYLECMVILDPRFDRDNRHPWVRDILRRKDLDGEEKMQEIRWQLVFNYEEPPG